ncbi:hypothetical protein C0J52_13321 [Blattella germanica]|nr:hypothetical protein C0J52_13321 [Blattella germanica]
MYNSTRWMAPQEVSHLDSQTFTKTLRHLPSSIKKIFVEISRTEAQNENVVLVSDMEDQQIILPQNKHGVQPPQEGGKEFQPINSNKVYTCKGNLRKYIKIERGRGRMFQCPYCSCKTKYESSFMSHIRVYHKNEEMNA